MRALDRGAEDSTIGSLARIASRASCLGHAFVQGCVVGNDPLPPSVRDGGM